MKLSAIVVATAAGLMPQLANAQDVAAGEQAFQRCTACHSVGENAAHRMGPQLNNIFGQQAGTQEGFGYSQAMIAAGQEGLVWTPETLTPFIRNPREFLPGTKMAFAGLGDDETIADVIAYLMTFSPDYVPGETTPPEAPAEVPAPSPAQ
jgi:cytochrome c2